VYEVYLEIMKKNWYDTFKGEIKSNDNFSTFIGSLAEVLKKNNDFIKNCRIDAAKKFSKY
jgi:hypothetical protein